MLEKTHKSVINGRNKGDQWKIEKWDKLTSRDKRMIG